MKNIVQQEGTDLIAEVDYREGSPSWVIIAYLGGQGLFIVDSEWDAFMQLVTATNTQVCAERGKKNG